MNHAMHSIMLSCEKATFFITKRDYVKLSCKENLQLKMHLMGCKFCRNFDKQNTMISEKLNTLQENPPSEKLSDDKKLEIQQLLDEQ